MLFFSVSRECCMCLQIAVFLKGGGEKAIFFPVFQLISKP